MSLLANEMREMYKGKRGTISESELPVGFMTTFPPLDYALGMKVRYYDRSIEDTIEYDQLGFTDGGMLMVVGKSGSGKSAIVAQLACTIISMFPDSLCIYDDAEGGMSLQRMANITKLSPKLLDERVIHRNVGITSESFFERITKHCDKKIEASLSDPERLTFFTGLYKNGKPIYKLIPTVYVLDSLALLCPESLTEDEKIKGQMSATSVAKLNTQIYTRINQKLKAANVILITVNHLNDNVSINPYENKGAIVNYLSQNVAIPGGKRPVYLADKLLEIVASDKLTDDKTYGINGYIVRVKVAKARTTRAGKIITLVFDQNKGYDRVLSNFIFLKDMDMIESPRKGYYNIVGHPEHSVTLKNIHKVFEENIGFRIAMRDAIMETGQSILTEVDLDEEDKVANNLLDLYKYEEPKIAKKSMKKLLGI